jgi:hypothetical protein
MKLARHRPLIAALLLMLVPGCRTSDKPRHEGKEYQTRKECNKPAWDCYDSCTKRDEGLMCGTCCADQRYLCDHEQSHDFGHCETINTRHR